MEARLERLPLLDVELSHDAALDHDDLLELIHLGRQEAGRDSGDYPGLNLGVLNVESRGDS